MLVTIQSIDINNGIATVTFSNGYTAQSGVFPPAPAPVVVAPSVVTPRPGNIIRGGYFDFIPDGKAKSYADQFGMSYVRMWHTIKWDETLGTSHPTFVRARALQAQGLKTLVVMTPPEKTGAPPADPFVAAKYFAAAGNAAKGAVDAWEIGNEQNLSNYNTSYAAKSTLWISNMLAPAYVELHAQGQFVVSGGWSETLDGIPWMISNGLLKNCDAVGYHPYGWTGADQINRVKAFRNLIGAKPLWLTEWNLHMGGKPNWADDLIVAAAGIAPYVQAVIHFRMVRTTQAAGFGAPFWNDAGTILPTAEFHDKLIAAMSSF
jgi:hypothetical protein